MNERIIAALNTTDPVKPNVYTGEATTYYTFNYNTMGANFADDAPGHERYFIQVHFVCPVNYDSVSRRVEIKNNLFDAGFTWPSMTDVSDSDRQHWVFECEYAEGVCDGIV